MYNYIEELKNDDTINRIRESNNTYGIRVLGRGENLFFQENNKALICQIDAAHGIIFTKSIKNWEGEPKMSKDEKERVTALIEKYYKEIYNPNIELSDGKY